MNKNTIKPSPLNSLDQFMDIVDSAILDGNVVEVGFINAPASHLEYIRDLYSAGKIDWCRDYWVGVITFASPKIARLINTRPSYFSGNRQLHS